MAGRERGTRRGRGGPGRPKPGLTGGVPVPGSFRDPSGFVFERDGRLLRQVNAVHRDHYDLLLTSGLYEALTARALLLPHREVDEPGLTPEAYRVLEPERVGFISYPYEWSFGQLKAAALLTGMDEQQVVELAGRFASSRHLAESPSTGPERNAPEKNAVPTR